MSSTKISNYHEPFDEHVNDLQRRALALANTARRLGLVLTIVQVPTQPLRMGGHIDKVTISPRRRGAP